MSRVDELLAEFISLPLDERRVLIEKAIESMPLEEMGSWMEDPEFLAELDRRFFDGKPRIPESELWKRVRKS